MPERTASSQKDTMPSAIGYPKEKKLNSARMRRLTQRAKDLLKEAREYRRATREHHWRRAEALYVGDHWGDKTNAAENDLITVNYAGSTINTIIPFVAANPPQFRVEPLGGEATLARAREQTAYLNRWWRSNKINGNQVLRRTLFDYLTYGDGWFMPTWNLETQDDPESAYASKTSAEMAVHRIDPWDMWFDINERWAIRRFQLSVEELKQDPRYKNTSQLNATHQMMEEDKRDRHIPVTRATSHERDQLVDVFEFYDLVTDELLVFTETLDVPLRFVSGIQFPLVNMGNYVIPGSPYHMGELEQVDMLQMELNKARSQMVSHRRRNVQKFAARKDALSHEAKRALRSEIVNDVVEIDDRGTDLKDVVMPLDVPLLSPDAYNSAEISKQDMFDITGVSEYLRGSVPSGRRTATEASIVEGANNVKTAHKLRAVEDALQKLGQLIIEIARDVFPLTDEDEAGMIVTGREAQSLAAAGAVEGVSRDQAATVASARLAPSAEDGQMWKGEYQVFVEASSTELRDPFIREQKFRQLFTDIMGFLPVLNAQGINPDVRKLLELWFEAAGVEDFESIFGTAPPPQRSPEQLSAIQQGGNALNGGQAAGLPALGNVGPPVEQATPDNSGLLPVP